MMRSYFYTLLNDLSRQMQLPFDSHLEGSRVRFKIDKDYHFGLALDNSEEFLIFECFLLERRFVDTEAMTYLRLNFAAAYHDGCFISVDPNTDSVALLARLPLQGLEVARVIEMMETMLQVADKIIAGDFSRSTATSAQAFDFLSQMRA
ncbi:MAG: hypothetical protein C5B47_06235 [Verrucomicrobia bacterium]|nr:MAG: hypothetical protein C5B47_06235 [Verrucomicrobiota bacterium]